MAVYRTVCAQSVIQYVHVVGLVALAVTEFVVRNLALSARFASAVFEFERLNLHCGASEVVVFTC